MALASSTDGYLYNELQSLSIQKLDNAFFLREARTLLAKKLIKAQILLKLKKKTMQQVHSYCDNHMLTSIIPIPATAMYKCQQEYAYPLTMSDWHPMNPPLYAVQHVPLIVPKPISIFTTVTPILTPVIPETIVQNNITDVFNYANDFNYSTEHNAETEVQNEQVYNIEEKRITDLETITVNNVDVQDDLGDVETPDDIETQGDPLEFYLKLPKELFPTPRMMSLDPNPIIDEFCKMPNVQRHTPWILDLEFGIPRTLVTRPIPFYNVKFNSINCKNTPDAIHPGFETCDPDFKRVLLFYYDCIVSAWYRGYMIMNNDISVENFQSWLLLPMQVLGMCWP